MKLLPFKLIGALLFTYLTIFLYKNLEKTGFINLKKRLVILVSFILVSVLSDNIYEHVYISTIAIILIIASLYDEDHLEIPDSTHFLLVICLIVLKRFKLVSLLDAVFITGIIIVILEVFKIIMGNEGMGGGDVKLYFIVFLFFDLYQDICVLFISCVIGIFMMMISNKRCIAFCPAISLAMTIMLLI